VLYSLPFRDCSGAGSWLASSALEYRNWVDQITLALGMRRAIFIVEPDSLAQLACLSQDQQLERLALINYAVDSLSSTGTAFVYIDAGHARWIDSKTMTTRLKLAGIEKARGFSLNVSNFDTTDNEIAYGAKLSSALGGKPYVIDVSRNGLGRFSGPMAWCNPPGRAVGQAPTVSTGQPGVDALLWIKTPGISDGNCGRGEPDSGTFWAGYAEGLAQRAGW
jgi:endoglucanase